MAIADDDPPLAVMDEDPIPFHQAPVREREARDQVAVQVAAAQQYLAGRLIQPMAAEQLDLGLGGIAGEAG
ncbi:MAG: hypothetical protein FJY40_08010, partial [Betaproteobacteria bacterium]|nr:hypothetical protein [Betaproteobacteria bacterium]